MNKWNQIYKKEGSKYVSQVNDWQGVIKFFKDKKIKTILDLGCGNGEHLFQLSNNGFKVTGMDLSKEAIRLAKVKFKENNLVGNFYVSSMHKKLPFSNEQFDAVICLRTLNHGTINQIQKTVNEIYRILKKEGLVFVNTIKINGEKNRIGKGALNQIPVDFIAPYTYKPLKSKEIGITHYLFNKKTLSKVFNKFKIVKFWLDIGKRHWEKYYCLLAYKD